MKLKSILLPIILMSCFISQAQDYKVIDMESMPMDMTARRHTVKGPDGKECALFRIATQNITPEQREGFFFECDLGSYVAQKSVIDGEIYVWVSPGLKTLKIKHSRLGSWDLHVTVYGITVESLHTYKIVIQGTMASIPNGMLGITQQYLVFQISPTNATLEVNGEKWEVGKDGSAMKYVPFGNYSYRVQASDYHSKEGTVTVDDYRNTKKVSVNLNPDFGWVEVPALGNLQDASVYVDNVFLGNAPCKSKALKSGSHNLRITKELYYAFDTTLVVNENETTVLAPVLKTDSNEVTLTVDADAEIWVNGQKKGVRTWIGPLDSGTYTIECRQEGCETTTLTKEIRADALRNTVNLPVPQPVYGSLNIETTPSFVEVYLDDKAIGETPMFVPDIPVGKHELRLAKQGYSEYIETIEVSKGKPTQIQVSLDDSFAVWFNCNVENARLTIDDKFVGNANGVYELSVGKHKVLASAFGYQDFRKTIEVGEDKTNFPIGMRSLSPDSKVQFICEAPDAQLSIDGNLAGSASGEYELNYGTHHIKVIAKGFLDYEEDIEIFEKKHDVQIEMKTAPISIVRFICDVSDAQLSIDDSPALSILAGYQLSYGTHHIKVTAEGFLDYEKDIEIFEKEQDIIITMDEIGKRLIVVKGIPVKMVWIEGESFQMGLLPDGKSQSSSTAKQIQSVTLSDYYIGEAEVTQALWKAVMGSNPSINVGDNKPVDNVSWDDCQEFIRKLNQMTGKNFRLPTEAEWEFAARGGNYGESYKYAGNSNIQNVAWYFDNSYNSTSPVKKKQPNKLGIYDMSGNVCEWCNDWYGDYKDGAQSNPQGPSSGKDRVIRGGSYVNFKEACVVTERLYADPAKSSRSLGFRLALSE